MRQSISYNTKKMPVVTSLASNKKKPPIEPIDWRFHFYHLQQPGSKNTTGCIIFMHLSSQPSLWVELGSLLAKLELEDVVGTHGTQCLAGTYLLPLMNAYRFQVAIY